VGISPDSNKYVPYDENPEVQNSENNLRYHRDGWYNAGETDAHVDSDGNVVVDTIQDLELNRLKNRKECDEATWKCKWHAHFFRLLETEDEQDISFT